MDEVEVKDFYFRQLRKVRVGDTGVPGNVRCSLLCSSNEFGLTFVGCSKGVHVFKTSVLYEIDGDDSIGSSHAVANGSLLKGTIIPTPSPPLNVALSCDNITLSVCLLENGILKCYFYDIRSLSVKGASLTHFSSLTLSSTTGVQLSCLHWNPHEYPEQLAVSTSDGTLHLLAVINDVNVQQQKLNLHANAVCWSPKGKQLAVGLQSGGILQLSPSKNLEQKKSYPCPDLFNGEAHRVTDLFWIATHVFAAIFTPVSPSNNTPSLVFIFTSKDQPPRYVNCEDVYYGEGKKTDKFYFTYLSAWGIFISCSANAMETVVHSHDPDNNSKWVQWELEDTGRAELPLEGSNETYSAGMSLDLTSKKEVHVSETLILPPSPLLLLYSDRGVLCPYTVVNKNASAIKLKELVRSPKPLPNDPRLIRQRKPDVQASPPAGRSAPASSVSAAPTQVPPQPAAISGLMMNVGQQQNAPPVRPGGSLGFTVRPTEASSIGSAPFLSSLGQTPPLSSLGQPAAHGRPPPFGPSSLMTSLRQPPPFSGTGQALPLGGTGQALPLGGSGQAPPLGGPSVGSPFNFPTGPSSGTTGATQQPRLPTTTPVLGGSGVAGSTQQPSSFPFSLGSLTSAAMPSPKPPQQQPLSLPQSSLPPPTTTPAMTGYLTQQQLQQKTPPTAPKATPPAVQVPSGQVGSQLAAGSSGTGAPPRLPGHVTSQQSALPPSMAVGNLLGQSTPAQPGQLTVRPLHSSTPLTHPGLLPPTQMGPRPPTATVTQAPLNRAAVPGPGTMAPPTRPPAAQTMAPKPQAPHNVGLQRPPPTYSTPPPTYGAPPPSRPATSGATVSPQRSRPPPTATAGGNKMAASSLLNQDQLESKFSNYIQKEIEGYIADLESLKDDMMDLFGDWEGVEPDKVKFEALGGMEDLVELGEETQLVESDVSESVDTFKSFDARSSRLLEDTLKVYSMQEEAKANLRKKMDPSYSALLKVRPLDPYSAQRLNDLRDSFLKTEQTISEVNSQLDAQLEKKYEEKRQAGRKLLKVPSIQMVYSTLRDHKRITRVQNTNIDRLTKEMKQLKLIPLSWRPSDVTSPLRAARSPRSPASSPRTPTKLPAEPRGAEEGGGELSGRGLNGDVMQTPVIDRMLNSKRLAELRESLGAITQTPVRTLQRDPTYTLSQLQKDRPSSRAESVPPSHTTGDDLHVESVSQTHLDSLPQSLRSSQTSLSSHKPDVVLSGAQGDISFRSRQGFQTMNSLQSSRQSSIGIDALADPQGRIAIMVGNRSQPQVDLSPPSLRPPPGMPVSTMGQLSPLSVARGPLQYGSPPFTGGAQPPKTAGSPYGSGPPPPQVPTSISPKKGGTISWGAPPTSSDAPPKLQTQPGGATTSLSKPLPQVGGAAVSLAHSSSAPSLVKPPVGGVPLPFLGQGAAKNGLPQPFGQSFPFGGSTNPLGELKRSEPVGDLTQIRMSAQKGQSPASSGGGGGSGNGLVGHQASSVSVPNVAMTTASGSPFSLTSKLTSSLSSSLVSTEASKPPFSFGSRTSSTASSPPKPAPGPPSTSKPLASFTIGSSSQPPTSTPAAPPTSLAPPPSFLSSAASSSKPAFPFGSSMASPQFTFSFGSTAAPSFTAGQSQPTTNSATPTTTAAPTSSTQLSGSGNLFASMPKFNLGGGGGLSSLGGSPFTFSAQPSSLQTSSVAKTTAAKMSPLTTPGSSLLATLQTAPSSAPPTSTPFSFSTTGGSGPGSVFGNSSMTFGLSSLLSKKPDAVTKPPGGGEVREEEEEEAGESDGSSGSSEDTNGGGGEGGIGGGGEGRGEDQATRGAGEPQKPSLVNSSSALPPSTVSPLLGVQLPSIQKVSSEGDSKTIPQIVKPSPPTSSQLVEATNRDGMTVPDTGAKPGGAGYASGGGQEMGKKIEVPVTSQTLSGVGGGGSLKREPVVKTSAPSVSGVKDEGKTETTPPAPVTAVPTPLPQSSQAAVTATVGADKKGILSLGAPKDSKEVPPPLAGAKKEEETVAKALAPPVASSGADKVKQPSIDWPVGATTATVAPTTSGPTVQAAATSGPAVQAPTTSGPTVQAATTSGPTVQAAATSGPAVQAATTLGPTVQAATTSGPTVQAATTSGPTVQAATTSGPTVQAATTSGPTVQAATTSGPTVQAATTSGPTVQAATTSGPTVQAATTSGPTVQAATTSGPTLQAATGLSLQQQVRSGSQTSLLSLDDTEGDMEGEMEDAGSDQLSTSDTSGLFLGGSGFGLGGLGGRPSNVTANPFGGGMAATTAMRTTGGPFASSAGSSGGGMGLLKPSALGSNVISPPRFTSPSGGGLFSTPPASSAQLPSSSSSMGQGGFGAGPMFGSSAGLGASSGLGGFGSPPQVGAQSAMMGGRLFGSVPGGSSLPGSSSGFGALASGGGGNGGTSFGSLAQQGQSSGFAQQGQSSGFGGGFGGAGSNTGAGGSFSQWRR